MFKLVCQIDNATTPVNTLQEGIQLSMEGEVEKMNNDVGVN